MDPFLYAAESSCFEPPNESPFSHFTELMPLEDLHDESNGFIVNDTLIFQAEFLAVSKTKMCGQKREKSGGDKRERVNASS